MALKINEQGWDKIKNAPTGKLRVTLAQLERILILTPEQWLIYRAVKQELAWRTYEIS